jgi:hypothetical protein
MTGPSDWFRPSRGDIPGLRRDTGAEHRGGPGACPVIIRSLSPMARRIAELAGLDLANLQELSLGQALPDWFRDGGTTQQDLAPVEPGPLFLAGTEGCP